MAAVKKSRAINFTAGEIRVLTNEIVKRDRIINGELSAYLTNAHKQKAWDEILTAVNTVAPATRQIDNLKSKWKDLKKATKKKISSNKKEMNKTGGGIADLQVLTDNERLIETQIGKASLLGVGGVESMTATSILSKVNVGSPGSMHDMPCDFPIDIEAGHTGVDWVVSETDKPRDIGPTQGTSGTLPARSSSSPVMKRKRAFDDGDSDEESSRRRKRPARDVKAKLQSELVKNQGLLVARVNQLVDEVKISRLEQKKQFEANLAMQNRIANALEGLLSYVSRN